MHVDAFHGIIPFLDNNNNTNEEKHALFLTIAFDTAVPKNQSVLKAMRTRAWNHVVNSSLFRGSFTH